MRILVFDYSLTGSGHYVAYVRPIVDAVNAAGHEAIAAFPSAVADSPAIKEYFPNLGSDDGDVQTLLFDLPEPQSVLQHGTNVYNCLATLIRENEPDHVVIPTGDLIATKLALKNLLFQNIPFKSVPISVMMLRGDFAYPDASWTSRMYSRFKWFACGRYPWNRFAALDPLVWKQIKGRSSVDLCPDPVPPRPDVSQVEARRKLDLPVNEKLIVSVGGQHRDKGADLLVDAFASQRWADDEKLVLIGRHKPEIRDHIKSAQSSSEFGRNIISIDRFLSDEEFQLGLLSADLVALPYRKTNRPSGIISRCVSWQIPIVGSNTGWADWACRELGAGRTADVYDKQAFGHVMQQVLRDPEAFTVSKKAEAFSKFNTLENYQEFWLQAVVQSSQQSTVIAFV